MHGLDVQELQRSGWKPYPFTEFVLKIHSRCNIACKYCYVYEHADQSWQNQPTVMSESVVLDTCNLIREHAERHSLATVSIVLHGGEPLLAGHNTIEAILHHLSTTVGQVSTLRIGIQTNGLLIDEKILRLFDREHVRVGISLDGGLEANDRNRTFRNGNGTFDRVAEKLELIGRPEYRHLFSGLLCAIDLRNDPVETYEALLQFAPPAIDFLLPHANWASPPKKHVGSTEAPYGDWLIQAFERWYTAPRLQTRVRIFSDVIRHVLGRRVVSEAVGLEPVRLVVVETDGSLEQVDTLKSAHPGAAKIASIDAQNSLDLALWHPGIVARQIGLEALCSTCRQCTFSRICGGGTYTHRFDETNGFLNPSVYCPDLMKFIGHVQERIMESVEHGLVNGSRQ
jgi:uncharacterized protein